MVQAVSVERAEPEGSRQRGPYENQSGVDVLVFAVCVSAFDVGRFKEAEVIWVEVGPILVIGGDQSGNKFRGHVRVV